MQRLLTISNIDNARLKTLIHRATAFELDALVQPCYYPPLKKYYYDFIDVCGVTETDVKQNVADFYRGTPAADWLLHRDPITHLYVFCMYNFAQKKDQVSFLTMMVFFMVRTYTNSMNKMFPKYCDDATFKWALEHLNKTHLFAREGSIPQAIYFLAREMHKKYMNGITNGDVDEVAKFITESKTRIMQSLRSFAELYFYAKQEGIAYKETKEESDDEGTEVKFVDSKKESMIVKKAADKIAIYREIDKKAYEESRQLTKIGERLSKELITGLHNVNNHERLKIIYDLYLKEIKTVDMICGKEYYGVVKALMATKRTIARVYFKQQIAGLVEDITKIINYNEQYKSLSNQTRFLINLFIAYYVTMVIKNITCH